MRMWGRRQIGILLFAHIVVANAAESSESAVIKKCRLAMSGKKVSDPNCREPALRVLRTIGVRHLFSARSQVVHCMAEEMPKTMSAAPGKQRPTEDGPHSQHYTDERTAFYAPPANSDRNFHPMQPIVQISLDL